MRWTSLGRHYTGDSGPVCAKEPYNPNPNPMRWTSLGSTPHWWQWTSTRCNMEPNPNKTLWGELALGRHYTGDTHSGPGRCIGLGSSMNVKDVEMDWLATRGGVCPSARHARHLRPTLLHTTYTLWKTLALLKTLLLPGEMCVCWELLNTCHAHLSMCI